jgi:integrase
MSVSKDPRSPYWRFDFQYRGHRFFGSTKATTRREAEAIERAERERAKATVAQATAARTSLRLDDVAGRYWNEVGQHNKGARDTHRVLGYLIKHFGKDMLLAEITGNDVARLVAWRRGHRNSKGELLSPCTVNATTLTLKKLFTRAKVWGVRFDHEPRWKDHWLKEPPERVRELIGDEAERIEAATREDYAPFFAFAKASGLRFTECLMLRWSEVNWLARQIRKQGKGDKWITVPLTSAIHAILWPLQGHHPDLVFTYVARYTRGHTVRGQRYPLTSPHCERCLEETASRSRCDRVSVPRLPAQSRNQGSARDWQPQAGAKATQSLRHRDDDPLCACARWRGRRSVRARHERQEITEKTHKSSSNLG